MKTKPWFNYTALKSRYENKCNQRLNTVLAELLKMAFWPGSPESKQGVPPVSFGEPISTLARHAPRIPSVHWDGTNRAMQA